MVKNAEKWEKLAKSGEKWGKCLSVFCVSAVLIYIHMHGTLHGTS